MPSPPQASIPLKDDNLPVKIDPIDGAKLIVKEFSYYEALSEDVVFELIVYPQDPTKRLLDMTKWRLANVHVSWTTKDGTAHIFRGKIDQAYCLAQSNDTAFYKITARPALTLFRGNRFKVHQKDQLTFKNVIDDIMTADTLASAEGHVEKNSPTFKTRTIVMQYDESDWDLIKRYLSYEGIFYYWNRSDGCKWTMDHQAPSSTPEEIQFRWTSPFEFPGIVSFNHHSNVRFKTHTVKDYNYLTTQAKQFGLQNQKTVSGNTLDEITYFPGQSLTDEEATTNATSWANGDSVPCSYATGMSNCEKLCPLYCFKVKDYPSEKADTKDTETYYITGIRHHYTQVFLPNESLRLGDPHEYEYVKQRYGERFNEKGPVYWNTFKALPTSQIFCPKPIPRPATMILSGRVFSAGENEVDLDDKGRILVQFPWDTEHNTCRIRFMQPWAGAGFGVVFVPRVGMEVIVGFENNDLDRPLVLGCVHNNMDAMNAQVTGDPTTSLIRTQSSKYDENKPGFNELRFVDKAGEELLYTHAQKDAVHVIEKNSITNVLDNSYELSIWAEKKKVGDAPVTVSESDRCLKFYIEDGKQITMIKKGNQEHTIEEGDIVVVNKKGAITITDESGDITIEAKSGNVTVKASAKLTLQGQNILIKADQKVEIQGMEIDIKGDSKIDAKAPQISIAADAKLEAKGGQVSIEGTAQLEAKAPMVKINADGMLQAQSSGITQIKGSMTMIN